MRSSFFLLSPCVLKLWRIFFFYIPLIWCWPLTSRVTLTVVLVLVLADQLEVPGYRQEFQGTAAADRSAHVTRPLSWLASTFSHLGALCWPVSSSSFCFVMVCGAVSPTALAAFSITSCKYLWWSHTAEAAAATPLQFLEFLIYSAARCHAPPLPPGGQRWLSQVSGFHHASLRLCWSLTLHTSTSCRGW